MGGGSSHCPPFSPIPSMASLSREPGSELSPALECSREKGRQIGVGSTTPLPIAPLRRRRRPVTESSHSPRPISRRPELRPAVQIQPSPCAHEQPITKDWSFLSSNLPLGRPWGLGFAEEPGVERFGSPRGRPYCTGGSDPGGWGSEYEA
ncbi:uncharacterized protein LOC116195879 [Punica granatum]|uniref:Uncharacterized protein LOC116195879 n=1 Tax=Punica granatum TaxID=22663 RepID=A0A218X397_PUNGR|nr:uncharacterized protein LOC116195879 [Punica granatum]OWM78961.1 hypothetical protein CDL15_Pgr003132 [Punica granatum]